MIIAIVVAVIFCCVLFVPVWIRVRMVLDEGKFRLLLQPWGLSIGGGRILSWISRRMETTLHRALSPKPKKAKPPPSDAKPKKSALSRLPWKFILWMAGRVLALVAYLTRRLTFRLAGWDPALMGFCEGTIGGALAAWGVRVVRWESDFSPRSPYAELTWDVGSNLAGLCIWVGRSVMRMPPR